MAPASKSKKPTLQTPQSKNKDDDADKGPLKINLYESNALKSSADDTARAVVLESGYVEDLFVSNVRLVMGISAIGLAIFSHFGPGKFPSNYAMVMMCVVGYVVLSVLLTIFAWLVEKDAFLITKPRKGTRGAICLSSSLERHQDTYTLIISPKTPSSSTSSEVKSVLHLAEYYHEDGYMAEEKFKQAVAELLAIYESGIVKKAQ